ncbi:psbP domain-containing protein 3, chloroplastic isoform X2 [Elaeis guineensis]|uniref:PsbP domain-containing protein 3, chloroplastic isoform X2 n=1 Tax=Elaeis guineensis var. tenera TaxID=51953 RepID=A0A6I9RTG2_ELAGV|nr:psbP domain-containing protein 3, chloroplastic isoform X2 [Elaeis guineensis]
MASVVSLRPPAPPPRHSAPPARAKVILQCRARPIPPSEQNVRSDERTRFSFGERSTTRRREALLQIFLSAVSFPFIANNASAETDLQQSFRIYEDEMNKFRISIPQDWLVGTGEANGIKSITAFYPKGTSDLNVSVVITGLGPDYTRLESFGTVDAFAESLVNGLDRSWKRPPGLAAKLINSKAANGLYYVEYTLQNPGEKCRHILSAIGMASNGWYNRLYTVTGQFMEDESEKYRSQIEQSVSSFRLI